MSAFDEALARVIQIHRVWRRQPFSEEAYEKVAEQLDEILTKLDPIEVSRLEEIAADLDVTEPGGPALLPSERDIQFNDLNRLVREKRWDDLLRQTRQVSNLSAEQLAWFRAIAYEGLGQSIVSLELAFDLFLDTGKEEYGLLGLFALDSLPIHPLGIELASLLASKRQASLFANASAFFFLLKKNASFAEPARSMFLRVGAQMLESLIPTKGRNAADDERAFAHLVLGSFYLELKRGQEASEAFRQALDVDPTNVEVLQMLTLADVEAKEETVQNERLIKRMFHERVEQAMAA